MSDLVEMTTKNMVLDHNKLVSQYYELLTKYEALLALCVQRKVK